MTNECLVLSAFVITFWSEDQIIDLDLEHNSKLRVQVLLLRKEVIQPQVPLRLPCYDFTPVIDHKVGSDLPKVSLPTSFAANSHGVTGGVYKALERIHRSILICDY